MPEATVVATQIPTSFYIIAGTLVIANLGTVVTIFYGIGRVVWFIAKLDSRIATVESRLGKDGDVIKDIDAAHGLIRELKKERQLTQ